MKKWLSIGLGTVTATGGFLDAGTLATAGESGAKFGLGLIWAIVLATIAIVLLVEMVGRFTAVSKKTYADCLCGCSGLPPIATLEWRINDMPEREDQVFSVRDIINSQLESSDAIKIGRVADLEV